uniref:Uncharacterized protein n=1 Tax=Rhizophora mucronata TaxID=61149 RepID=A0A2P2QLA6_RHIMU
MGSEDPWLASDKLYHVVFCLSLTLVFSKLAFFAPYPKFLRRRSVWVGSIVSLAAGAAKEAADHLGLFPSAGASAKDAAADLLGVLIAAFALSIRKTGPDVTDSGSGQTRRGLPV